MTDKQQTLLVKTFFFCLYVGYGVFFPMISIYLKEKQFTGIQMGVLMSVAPLIQMIFQPIWGMIADYFQCSRLVLMSTAWIAAGFLVLIPLIEPFQIILLLFILFAIFQSAMNPLADSLVVSYSEKIGKTYGDFRLWGAVSFALAAWIIGLLGKYISLDIIFYIFAGSLPFTALLGRWLPCAESPVKVRARMRKDLSILFRQPTYLIFLFATFCVLGPMLANNNFFGLFYQFIGGTLAGVGLCFLIGAGSEAPFMKLASGWIRKYGYLPTLFAAAVLSAIQYFSYAFDPPLGWVPWITLLQGFSIGLFIPASVQMAGKIAPASIRTTAIAVYTGMTHGIGTWFFIFFGGLILDFFPVTVVYWFFTGFTLLGILFLTIQGMVSRRSMMRT